MALRAGRAFDRSGESRVPVKGESCANRCTKQVAQLATPIKPLIFVGASVAQLDRASDFGSEGCRFKSCRTRQFIINVFQQQMM